MEKPKYPKELDIGRIVIEELPQEKEVVPKREFTRKEVRPKGTEVTVTRREVEEVPSTQAKEQVIKVGKLDVTDLEKTPVESKGVEERIKIYRERVDGARKPRKEEKPKDQSPEERPIEDVHYRKEKGDEIKPCMDETRVSRREVTTEKVTVTRADGTRTEEIKRPKYPKEREVGRIVIEEMPDEKEEKPHVYRKHPEKPTTTDVTVKRVDVTDTSRPYQREDVIKVGRLDVHGLEKTPEEARRVEERMLTQTERVERHRKVKKDEIPDEQLIDRLHVKDLQYEKRRGIKPKTDDTTTYGEHISTEKVSVSRHDITRTEEMENPKYPKDLDIGRIVIEELPEEKEVVPKREFPRKEVRPKSTEVTVTRREVEEVPSKQVKEEVIKVGKLDVTDLEKTPVESKGVEERIKTYRERVDGARKVKKDEKPEEQRIDHLHVKDVEFGKISEIKPQSDDTKISGQYVTTEKVTVSRRDISRAEETEKPRYPRDLDIGRIVIEEVPDEEEEIRKRDVSREQEVRPTTTDMAVTRHEVKELPSSDEKEDVIKVGRLDVTGLEKATVESRKVKEKVTTYTERVDGARKPRKEEKPEDRRIDPRYVEDVCHYEEKRGDTKPRVDETRFSQGMVSTEKVTVTRVDGTRTEEIERYRYPREHEFDRMTIEEKSKEDDERPQVYRKYAEKPKTTEVTVTREDVTDVTRREEQDVMKVGRLDVRGLEKTPEESTRVEERFLTATEKVEDPRKVRKEKGPEEQRIERARVEDARYDKVLETKPRADDTEIFRKQVTTEKVTVSRRDITSTEETDKPRYPKDLDISRIVIEEIPEEKEEIPRREISKKDEARPKSTDVTVTRHEVKDVPSSHVKEEVIKVGKLDVTGIDQTAVESRRIDERVKTYRERVESARKPKKEKNPADRRIEQRYVKDVRYHEDELDETKPRMDETRVSRKEVTTEKVTATRASGTITEEIERAKYPKDEEVGRIVIEEMPEEEEKPRDLYKLSEKPRTSEVHVARKEVTDISKRREKDVTKVGKLDVHDFERKPVESRRVEERLLTLTERVQEPRKIRKEGKPDEERIDHVHARDVDFDDVRRHGTKPRTDDTEISRKHVTTEKVTVSRRDMITSTDETDKPKYAKELDIGRIVIEELPEEKEEVTKREVTKKDTIKPKRTEDVVTRYEVDDFPRTHVKEDVIKVGKIDITEYEKMPVESGRVEQRIATHRDIVQEPRKPKKEERPESDRRMEPRHIEVTCYYQEKREETKPHVDETRVSRREVATEKVTVTRADGTRTEAIERPKYPSEREVGRIIIEEMAEEKEEKSREVYRKFSEKPKTSELTITRRDVTDVSRPGEEEDVMKVGRLDVHELEKTTVESKRVEERPLKETERVEHHRKVRKAEMPEEQRFDRVHVKDIEIDKVRRDETKPRKDDTQISRKQVTTEKVTVSRRDITSTEETEKPKYPKDLDIGRIIIEELPEKKEEIPKRDVSRKETEVTVTREVKEVPRRHAKEDDTKVGKLEETDFEIRPWESRRVEERVTTYKDRVDGARKPNKEQTTEEQGIEPRYIEDVRYFKERRDETKPRVDETRVSRKEVTTEKVTVTRADGTRTEEIERPKYPKEQEVGRIIIEEIPEKKEETERVEGPRKAPRKDEKPEKQRAGHLLVEDVETIRRYETKPRQDDTKVSRKQVTTEKVTVSRHDIEKIEQTEKPKYPKEVDIGRIVIEEIPREEPTSGRKTEKPIGTEVSMKREVREVQKADEKEDTIKVGKLDLRDVEKDVVESMTTEERLVTHRDRIDHRGKIVTDQGIVRETERGPGVAEDKIRMGRRPTDKIWSSVTKTGETGRVTWEKTDGGWYVDEKTGERRTAEQGVDAVRDHDVVRDSVWEESRKPLEESREEVVVSEETAPSESIVVTKEDRKKIEEDVRVSIRKVESAEKKEEMKVRRFTIDESRDAKGVKRGEEIKETQVKAKPKKEPIREQKRGTESREPQKPEKEKHLKEKETQTKVKIDERDRKIEYYERKEKERLQRAHDRQRYEEERYHMKRASSDPWILVRKQEKRPEFEIRATQVIHDPTTKYTGKYNDRIRRQPATLPWIEVRRREKSLAGKKSRHSCQLTQESAAKDRLLLLKIPQKICISMQHGDKSKMKEIEIPWLEVEASRDDGNGDLLPWIQLEARDSKTQRDRLIMLKIPREMVLKTSRFSRSAEREIQLPWNDVTRYWEETGQIPVGSAVRMRLGGSPNMSITLPREVNNVHFKSSSRHTIDDNLPTIRLMMPKRFYAERSWQDRPLINFDPNRRIKLRINNQSNSNVIEDVRTIRLDEYERKNNYMPVALTRDYPRRVLLADGTAWKRLDIDDLASLDKEKLQCNPSRFHNAYEIGKETEAHSFPDLREFAKENGGNNTADPKVFSFVINGGTK